MSNPGFDTNLSTRDGKPVITPDTCLPGTTASHNVQVANILTSRPIAGVIHHERIEILLLNGMLKRAFLISLHFPKFQCIRLSHDDEDLNRLGRVSGLTIGVRQGCLSPDVTGKGHNSQQSSD